MNVKQLYEFLEKIVDGFGNVEVEYDCNNSLEAVEIRREIDVDTGKEYDILLLR